VEKELDSADIVVRGGTLSAQPVFQSLGLPEGAVRASISFYNTTADLDRLIDALRHRIANFRAAS
jgi:cysteine desulfurase / selenocysteine lyase